MVNWLLVGIGDIARKRVIPALLAEPRGRLAGVVTRDARKAEPYGLPAWTTLESALAAERFDAVYIATPPALHAPQTLAALRAGSHVLCEKPFGMSFEQSRQVVDEARRLGRTLGVAYYRRCYPKVLKAKQLLADGAIGRPLLAELVHHVRVTPGGPDAQTWHFDPALAGGGPLYDVGSHRFDVLNFFFGQPLNVAALLTRNHPSYQVESAAAVTVEYPDGVRGFVDVSWESDERRDECRILGSRGEIRLSSLNGPSIEWPDGADDLPPHENLHLPCIADFVSAVQLGVEPLSSGETASWTDWVSEKAVLRSRQAGAADRVTL